MTSADLIGIDSYLIEGFDLEKQQLYYKKIRCR